MVKFMNAVIVAAIVATPALALATQEQPTELVSREPEPRGRGFGPFGGRRRRFRNPSPELSERDLEDLDELSTRNLEELEELATREPFGRGRGFGRSGGRRPRFRNPSPELSERDFEDLNELDTRELEDLEELAARDPRFGSFFKKVAKVGGRVAGSLFFRDLEDLDELDARRLEELEELAAREDLNELDARELEDLQQRFWFVGKIAARVARKAAGKFFGRDLEDLNELDARELEDLEDLAARDPRFGSFFKKVAKVGGRVAGSLFFRDLEDDSDLTAREMEIDELD
jgi:hypothetical protein